ncbi:superoxide dismutase family protein [Pedobacter flavus]|uniref:Superoxide dismutase [Cu-Zn] n=1 Tax=Pedobacter flavus TaxID=3113906 RepID=A0ABU7H0P3_9SPHI|nr:superoxide dismutase family protein [Pedobacter sp. VNH31]MEE1884805.1 superoxide dismutase family protein [Pedobacter sp. VNH31]
MKTKLIYTLLFGISVAISACSNEKNNSSEESVDVDTNIISSDTTIYNEAKATISGTKTDTTVTGTAKFVKKGDYVELTLDLDIPKKANSTVAVHLHEEGDCGDNGQDAHGHWNPTNESHGKWGAAQYHSGDIGNIKLDNNGKASFKLETNRWTIGGQDFTNILDKSIIIHAGVDDYKTQPTGNSGSRIGCGVINKM